VAEAIVYEVPPLSRPLFFPVIYTSAPWLALVVRLTLTVCGELTTVPAVSVPKLIVKGGDG
jgi:hypothetical protein